jgi:lipopolysaccharide/colanic/teichoic acid biosynthesis glycosyltransferase
MKSIGPLWFALIDRGLGVIMLVAILPVLLLISLSIQMTSVGPIFVVDDWVTEQRGVVQTYRLRTTGCGASVFQIVGRWLRRFSLDELPSLWNVVRGEIGLAEFLRRR